MILIKAVCIATVSVVLACLIFNAVIGKLIENEQTELKKQGRENQ